MKESIQEHKFKGMWTLGWNKQKNSQFSLACVQTHPSPNKNPGESRLWIA